MKLLILKIKDVKAQALEEEIETTGENRLILLYKCADLLSV